MGIVAGMGVTWLVPAVFREHSVVGKVKALNLRRELERGWSWKKPPKHWLWL